MRTACLAAGGVALMLAACGGAAPTDTVTVQETVTQAPDPGQTDATGGANEPAAPVDPNDPEEGTTAYEVYGNTWGGYGQDEKLAAAEAYLADHPDECGSADATTLASFVDASYGRDFPLSARASKLMRHLCGLAATGD
jgi:hypothetical protein